MGQPASRYREVVRPVKTRELRVAKWIETIPNISEGRRKEVIDRIVSRISRESRIRILNVSSDPDHNRTVLTMVGEEREIRKSIVVLFEIALECIDLRTHRGVHPRMGAVDVVPFVPLEDTGISECAALARDIGSEIADTFSLPVYLYEQAATRPERKSLETIRRGEFEGFPEKIGKKGWKPDFGYRQVHPTAGVVAIGARMPLIAFNVNLDTTDLKIAKQISKAVRFSNGGLPFVKAIGLFLRERNLAQVSMNLVDYRKTPIHQVFDRVQSEARGLGVEIAGTEIIGLVPRDAILSVAEHYLKIENFAPDRVLEYSSPFAPNAREN